MSKRVAETDESVSLRNGDRPLTADGANGDHLEFEDDFEDEFEEEDEIMVAGEDGLPDEDPDDGADKMEVDQATYIPGRNKLEAGQILEPDDSVYEMRHALTAGWPCLSCDIIRDQLGDGKARKRYPATVYAVAGTQADRGREKENELLVMKMSRLAKMDRDDESSDEEDDDDDDTDSDPIVETRHVKTGTTTNRVRVKQLPSSDPTRPSEAYSATMTENGLVLIHNLTTHFASFDAPGLVVESGQNLPVHWIKAHGKDEGYAVDWSPEPGQLKLLTGDTSGRIYYTHRGVDGRWITDDRPFVGHAGSVEEIQWSPSETTVFASASSDGTIRIWDIRSKARKPKITVRASNTDVNVLSWSRLQPYLLASGADDGQWAVWDLRTWKPSTDGSAIEPSPIANFHFHKEQITSVEWHPTDDSIVAVCAGDNTLSLWDLAVELDDEESKYTADVKDVPPQLLFVHYMKGVKEAHWHPQAPGQLMATGEEGFGVFKTISV